MLSSKNSASGINLTIANKIIFLEPIYGKEEYRKNIEYQAIGRADRLGQTRPIDIYRFIIKDTIEQDIYNNCIDDSKIKQIS
jgi:SNF2 family DNA or RNA helicase